MTRLMQLSRYPCLRQSAGRSKLRLRQASAEVAAHLTHPSRVAQDFISAEIRALRTSLTLKPLRVPTNHHAVSCYEHRCCWLASVRVALSRKQILRNPAKEAEPCTHVAIQAHCEGIVSTGGRARRGADRRVACQLESGQLRGCWRVLPEQPVQSLSVPWKFFERHHEQGADIHIPGRQS